MTLSNYLESQLVQVVTGESAFSSPAGVWLQLHTGSPGEAGTANVSAETDRRQVTFAAESGGSAAFTGTLPTWDPWDVGNEALTHGSLWDASTAGNCLTYGALSSTVNAVNGNAVEISGTFTLD